MYMYGVPKESRAQKLLPAFTTVCATPETLLNTISNQDGEACVKIEGRISFDCVC